MGNNATVRRPVRRTLTDPKEGSVGVYQASGRNVTVTSLLGHRTDRRMAAHGPSHLTGHTTVTKRKHDARETIANRQTTGGTDIQLSGNGDAMREIRRLLRERRERRKINVMPAKDHSEEKDDSSFDVHLYLSHKSHIPWNSGTSINYHHIPRHAHLNKDVSGFYSRTSSRKTKSEDVDSGWASGSDLTTIQTTTGSLTKKTLSKKISSTSYKTAFSSLSPHPETVENVQEVSECASPEAEASRINMKVDSDSKYCWITGSVLLTDNKILVCDHNNRCVKGVNLLKQHIDDVIAMTEKPWDITGVRFGHAFVTMPYLQEIHCLVLLNGVIYKRHQANIKVNGMCFGIASRQDTLIVTFEHPPKIEIIDTKGDVLKTFSTNNLGAQLCHKPKYVCTNPRGNLIYFTDWTNDSVICLTYHGTVLNTYKNYDLRDPSGLETDAYLNVYVCSRHTNTIHMLRSTGKRVKIAFRETDDIHSPLSITYHPKRNQLFVGNAGDYLKIFDIPFDWVD